MIDFNAGTEFQLYKSGVLMERQPVSELKLAQSHAFSQVYSNSRNRNHLREMASSAAIAASTTN